MFFWAKCLADAAEESLRVLRVSSASSAFQLLT